MTKSKTNRLRLLVDRILNDLESYEGSMRADVGRLYRDYLKPHRVRLLIAFFVTILWSVHPYTMALAGRFLVDHVLLVNGNYDPSMIAEQMPIFRIYVIVILALWGMFIISNWVRSWLILEIGENMTIGLRKQLHQKLQDLHVGYFEQHETGKIVSRVLDDVKTIRMWSTNQFLEMSSHFFRLFLGLGMALFLNWRLSLLVFASLPVYGWAYWKIRPLVRRMSIALRRLNSGMYALSSERISGVAVVKAFSQERRERGSFALRMNNYVRLALRTIFYQQGLSLLAGFITAVVSGVVIYYAVTNIRDGIMTVGDTIAYINVLPNLFLQVRTLAMTLTAIEAVFVVIRRVFYLLDEEEKVVPGRIRLKGMDGKVSFEHVTFQYPAQERPGLYDVTFHVAAGEKVAIMGPSGAGKTTVFQLLSRFYDPQKGKVVVGGVNLVDADPRSVRRHVVMVQQEPVIFSGTIGENIAYGNLDAAPSDIMRASRQAELHDFIMSLPVKYETEVGRSGIALSGGQKQRLALSSALLTDPEVLLLDDTTSALDAETEVRIRETLNRVMEGRTSLIITQRIATARDCDKIIVFEEGQVTQIGTHATLSKEDGFYKRIFEQQESI